MTRSIADQTVEELGGPGSVLVRQRNDHVKLDRLLRELDGSTGWAQEQVLRRIDRLVFSHAFAEETVLWPVLRRTLSDGDALTLRVEKEHQEVNELATELETLTTSCMVSGGRSLTWPGRVPSSGGAGR
jgi:iron-sulfur cluster repair protein YtfE (RIC family)